MIALDTDNEKKYVYCYTFIFLKRCHEQFEMPYGPDIVTFSKKMLSGGIYHNREHRPAQPGRVQVSRKKPNVKYSAMANQQTTQMVFTRLA